MVVLLYGTFAASYRCTLQRLTGHGSTVLHLYGHTVVNPTVVRLYKEKVVFLNIVLVVRLFNPTESVIGSLSNQ